MIFQKGTGLTKFLRTLSLREVFAPAQRAFAFNLVRILVQQTQDRLLLTPATSQAADTPDTSSDRTARPDNHQGRTVEMESPESKTGSLPSTPRTLTPSELGSEWSHYIRQGAPHGYPVRYPKKKREAADNQEPAAATEDQEMGGMDDVSSESWDEMNYLVMKPTGMTKQQVIEMNAAPAAKSPATTPFSAASSSAGPSAHQHGMTQDNLAAHTEQAPDPYGEGSLDRHVGGWLSGLAAGTPGPPPSMGEDEDVDMEDS